MVKQIEAETGIVVEDDLCSGRRFFLKSSSQKQAKRENAGENVSVELINLLDQINRSYRERIPCPSRVTARERFAHILALYQKSGSRGIIFAVPKFCDPMLADIPLLQQFLRKEEVPVLILEMDEKPGGSGQWKTRIEAFLEILSRQPEGSGGSANHE